MSDMDPLEELMAKTMHRLEVKLLAAMKPEHRKALSARDCTRAEELLAMLTVQALFEAESLDGSTTEPLSETAFLLVYSHRKLSELNEAEDRIKVLEGALAKARAPDAEGLQPIPDVVPEEEGVG